MKTIKVKCRHGVEYSTAIYGRGAVIARTQKMLEDCCCYVCYNRECKEGRTGKQECKNECELFTKSKYCERKEE